MPLKDCRIDRKQDNRTYFRLSWRLMHGAVETYLLIPILKIRNNTGHHLTSDMFGILFNNRHTTGNVKNASAHWPWQRPFGFLTRSSLMKLLPRSE